MALSTLTADRVSLNTATVKELWNLEDCVNGCARHGIGGISPWRDFVQATGVDKSAKLIKDAGLQVSGLCRGGWYTDEGALTQSVKDDNKRAVDEAVAIGAACLVMVVGGLPKGSRDLNLARSLVFDGLADTLNYARTVNMPIAIEPLHPMYAADRACVNTMAQALDICDELGDGIGVAMDAYHVWWDPELEEQIVRAGKSRMLAFHICDWLNPTSDLLTDRGMMGDGVIDLKGMREQVEAIGFDGLAEVEIFSAQKWWRRDPDEVLKTIVERCATVC